MRGQGHLSPKALTPATGRGQETCMLRPTVTFMPALRAGGREAWPEREVSTARV